MGQTLRYGSALLGLYADNTQGLVSAEAGRDLIVSTHLGGGGLSSADTVTIPIVSGTPVLINPLVTSPVRAGVFWRFDGNNAATSNYASALPSTTIPQPYYKALTVSVQMELNKQAAGADPYDFQLVKNINPIGLPIRVRYDSSEAKHVDLEWTLNADISSSDTYGVQVTGVGTGDDLTMSYFAMLMIDHMNWEAP
jgi:hypothetical protein